MGIFIKNLSELTTKYSPDQAVLIIDGEIIIFPTREAAIIEGYKRTKGKFPFFTQWIGIKDEPSQTLTDIMMSHTCRVKSKQSMRYF